MKNKKEASLAVMFIFFAIPILIFAAFIVIKQYDKAVVAYVTTVARPIRAFLGGLTTNLPISVAEIIYTLIGGYVIVHIVQTIAYMSISKARAALFFRRLFILIIVMLYIAALYTAVFGLDYYMPSFASQYGMAGAEASIPQLRSVTKYFAEKANQYSYRVERDAYNRCSESLDYIFAYAQSAYSGIAYNYESLQGTIYMPKKMFFSDIMSYIGFTGVYFPLTGESNINVSAPRAGIPETIAHEIAHQKGVTSEAECNFLGVLASTTSGIDAYAYSGYFTGLKHLMNALYAEDPETWHEIRCGFSIGLEADWIESASYWDKMDLPITHLSDKIYDLYLKLFGQKLGVKSYGKCVNLICEYYYPLASQSYYEYDPMDGFEEETAGGLLWW